MAYPKVPGSHASQMRARAIRRGVEPRSDAAGTAVGRSSTAALVFLRGRDADGRLRDLVAERAQARPVLGALAAALLSGRGFEPLGFRCLGDWSRERLGVGARAVREWVRVWRALEELPLLRGAVLSGEVSWTVARLIVGVVSPENEAACLETVRPCGWPARRAWPRSGRRRSSWRVAWPGRISPPRSVPRRSWRSAPRLPGGPRRSTRCNGALPLPRAGPRKRASRGCGRRCGRGFGGMRGLHAGAIDWSI